MKRNMFDEVMDIQSGFIELEGGLRKLNRKVEKYSLTMQKSVETDKDGFAENYGFLKGFVVGVITVLGIIGLITLMNV